ECVAHACESARSFIEELRDVRSASRAIRRARLDVDPAWASVAFIVAVVLVLQYRIAAPGLHGRDTSVPGAALDAIGLAAIPGIGCGSRLGAERYVGFVRIGRFLIGIRSERVRRIPGTGRIHASMP